MESGRMVVWFSNGIASAALAWEAIQVYGDSGRLDIVLCDTMENEHPDNRRFFRDVQDWLHWDIRVLRSENFRSVDDVIQRTRYISGPRGARCTTELKKVPREAYQRESDTHLFGYTLEERHRARRFERNNPTLDVEWLLIERERDKAWCFDLVTRAGIQPPAMYALGFDHNNCLGCTKSASVGYWNRTRRLFPEVFKTRALQSRLLGVRMVKHKGERIFLDEIPPDADSPDDEIECGPVCQTPTDESE